MDYMRPRSGYQPCETFFVEDDFDHLRAEKQAKQEHEKLVARERQYAIAEQLSRITSEELRDDVLSHMLEMDVSGDLLQLIRLGNLHATSGPNAPGR